MELVGEGLFVVCIGCGDMSLRLGSPDGCMSSWEGGETSEPNLGW